jgi:hypothetical protein
MPVLKRKRDGNPPSTSSSLPISRPKRRKFTLEHGFSQLSLNLDSNTAIHTPVAVLDVSANTTVAPPTILPSSVEEPPSKPITEAKMHNWYEPEKDRLSPSFLLFPLILISVTGIVITALDDSDSDSEPEATPISDIAVLRAVLDHMKENAIHSIPPTTKEPEMALVLFKPLVPFGASQESQDKQKEPDEKQDPRLHDDAMDVGP